uniref:Uncharacterized protein n=1 Tax=Panagrolaimus davidi TaxID=227884 RepID=A0A914QTQ2_9BILA
MQDSTKILVSMEIESGKLEFKNVKETISLWISEFEWTNANSLSAETGYNWKAIIPEILKLEDINKNFMEKLISGKNIQINIDGNGEFPAILITGFGDEKELNIAGPSRWVTNSSLTIDGTWKSINKFKTDFLQGCTVNVTSGYILLFEFDDGKVVYFSKNSFIRYSDSSLFYQANLIDSKIEELKNVLWDVSLNNNDEITLNIEKALLNENFVDNYKTIITFNNGKEIEISGGLLYRTSRNGYAITYDTMTGNGIDLNENELKKQNLLNLKAQKALLEIFGNVTDYLKKNGKNLDENDFENSAKNVLSISDDISIALGTSFLNPLESVAKESWINFDETFNWLRPNPAYICPNRI